MGKQIFESKLPCSCFPTVGYVGSSSTSIRFATSGVSGGVSGLKAETSSARHSSGMAGCSDPGFDVDVRGEMIISRGLEGLDTVVNCWVR